MAGQVWILEIITHDEHDYTDREDVYSSKKAAWPDFEALLRKRSDSDADFRFALEWAKEGEDGSVTANTPGSWQEIRLVPVEVLTGRTNKATSAAAAAEPARQ